MKPKSSELTDQQLECLFHLVKGKTIRKIGETMKLSHRTVEHYLEAVKIKLSCKTREELIAKAFLMPAIKNKLQFSSSNHTENSQKEEY